MAKAAADGAIIHPTRTTQEPTHRIAPTRLLALDRYYRSLQPDADVDKAARNCSSMSWQMTVTTGIQSKTKRFGIGEVQTERRRWRAKFCIIPDFDEEFPMRVNLHLEIVGTVWNPTLKQDPQKVR